jgi:DNA polymerase I-like protein with 3'-5' exonuclease and polymerase domains
VTSPLADVSLHLVESIDDAMALKRWLGERRDGVVAFDTESGGLSPWKTELRMVQFGDKKTGWAIPWERWGGVALEILRSYEGDWAAHNGIHDWKFLSVKAGFDIPWQRLHDTLTMARIDDPARSNGLKPLGSSIIDRRAMAGEKALKEGMTANRWTWATVPVNYPPYWIYSALDPVITAHLHDYLAPRVLASAPEAYDLERAANRICTKMMMKGMQLDVPYIERAIASYEETSGKIREWLTRAHQITSPVSAGQIRRAFERLGQEILFWTESGQPQFTKATLGFYMEDGQNEAVKQLAKYILAVRKADKFPRDYLHKFLDLRDAGDILRMSINVMGAITSRMSVSDPPLQQLSRDEATIRGSFIPREGLVLVSCDLDQIELRMIADASADEGLIRAIKEADATGTNVFLVIGREMYGEKITKKDPRYTQLKAFVYARAYGAGPETLAETAGIPAETVLQIEELFNKNFPGMRALADRLLNDAMSMKRRGERPGVLLKSGRFIPLKPGQEYAGLNYKTQGPAAEYMKQRLINIDASGLGDNLLLPIHDEALLEVPEKDAEEALKIVEECMTDRENYAVPLTAGGSILPERWVKT